MKKRWHRRTPASILMDDGMDEADRVYSRLSRPSTHEVICSLLRSRRFLLTVSRHSTPAMGSPVLAWFLDVVGIHNGPAKHPKHKVEIMNQKKYPSAPIVRGANASFSLSPLVAECPQLCAWYKIPRVEKKNIVAPLPQPIEIGFSGMSMDYVNERV